MAARLYETASEALLPPFTMGMLRLTRLQAALLFGMTEDEVEMLVSLNELWSTSVNVWL